MIQKLAKAILIFGMVLFFLGAVAVALSGMAWGWINGPVIVAAVGVVVLVVGAVAAAWIIGAAESMMIRFALIFQALRRIRAETEKQEMAADFFQVMHPTAGAVAVDRNGRYFYLQPPVPTQAGAGGPQQKEPDPEPEDDGPEIVGPLLPVLEGMNRILLIGGMGAGKTELLRHLAYAKSHQDGHVIICDSHAAPDTWPEFVQVAGIGRNYAEIEGAVNYVCDELDNRYKQRASGARKAFEPLTLIVDELFVLNQFCDLRAQFKSLLAESRKVNIGLIVAGQSDRAGALGLTGNKDLVAGFEACVYLERLDNGQRVGFIRSGNRRDGKYYLHPGPFRGRGGSAGRPGGSTGPGPTWEQSFGSGPHSPHGPHHEKPGFRADSGGGTWGTWGTWGTIWIPMQEIEATGRDREIIDLYRDGNTVSAIRKQVFGQKGGKYIKLIRGVLLRHGIA